MLIALWIVNALLALAMLAAGSMKLARSRDALISSGMGWAEGFSTAAVKTIAALEVIAAIGLILPLATGILPILAPLAALGLAVIMIGATVVHARRSETLVPTIVLTLLSVVSASLGFLVLA